MGKKNSSSVPALTEAQRKQKRKEAFGRVLPPRMDKALKAIHLVGECTTGNYLYTTEQADDVVDKLLKAVNVVKQRFTGEPGKSGGYQLPK